MEIPPGPSTPPRVLPINSECPAGPSRVHPVAAPVIQVNTQRRLEFQDEPALAAIIDEVSNNNQVCEHYRNFLDRCSFRRGWCRHEFFPYDSSIWMKEDVEDENELLENMSILFSIINEDHEQVSELVTDVVFKPSNN